MANGVLFVGDGLADTQSQGGGGQSPSQAGVGESEQPEGGHSAWRALALALPLTCCADAAKGDAALAAVTCVIGRVSTIVAIASMPMRAIRHGTSLRGMRLLLPEKRRSEVRQRTVDGVVSPENAVKR